MRRPLFAVLFVVCCCPLTFAQSTDPGQYPKVEAFVGYSANGYFANPSSISAVNQSISSFFSDQAGGNKGFEASVSRNLNKYVGLKGDFSTYFNLSSGRGGTLCLNSNCSTGEDFNINSRAFYLMGGPEVKARNRTRLTPFAHSLFGLARSRSEFKTVNSSFNYADSHTRTGFAMALGGGFDIRTAGRFSIRSLIDYVPTILGDADPQESGRQKHVRLSLGILFH
jgi:hypothetical protein